MDFQTVGTNFASLNTFRTSNAIYSFYSLQSEISVCDFCTNLVQSLYYVTDTYFQSKGVENTFNFPYLPFMAAKGRQADMQTCVNYSCVSPKGIHRTCSNISEGGVVDCRYAMHFCYVWRKGSFC
jgi:hypothetical protein